MSATIGDLVRAMRMAGWVLLALFLGSLVVAATSSGALGLALSSGGVLLGAAVVARLRERRPLLQGWALWVPLLLAGSAALIGAVRSNGLGLPPVRWSATLVAGVAVVLAVVGLIVEARTADRSLVRRSWVVAVVTGVVLIGIVTAGSHWYRTEDLIVRSGDALLAGTLLVPPGGGPVPVVLFLHGSGPETRSSSRAVADRLTRDGVAALIWDKRGSGGSVGGSPHDGFADLASDVAAWVEVLRARTDIDTDRLALWGVSEGAWIAPLAASRIGDVGALVLISPGVGFEETVAYEWSWRLREAGFAEADVARAIDLRTRINDYYRTGRDGPSLLVELAAATEEDWYRAAAVDADFLPSPGQVGTPGSPEIDAFVAHQDFTLVTHLARYEGPVLAAFGLQDRCNPAAANAEVVEGLLRDGGNPYRVLRYPEAGHAIAVWLTGERSCGRGLPPVSYPARFLDDVASWLTQHLDR